MPFCTKNTAKFGITTEFEERFVAYRMKYPSIFSQIPQCTVLPIALGSM